MTKSTIGGKIVAAKMDNKLNSKANYSEEPFRKRGANGSQKLALVVFCSSITPGNFMATLMVLPFHFVRIDSRF